MGRTTARKAQGERHDHATDIRLQAVETGAAQRGHSVIDAGRGRQTTISTSTIEAARGCDREFARFRDR